MVLGHVDDIGEVAGRIPRIPGQTTLTQAIRNLPSICIAQESRRWRYGDTPSQAARSIPTTFPAVAGNVWRIAYRAHSSIQRSVARRALEAMMEMTKIDIATIEAARRG
ncbi:hypothetical protein [Sulfuritalea sp.]|uniref:hypothetical protein n=1 Tax=Sulfuritalea sp. TaxID=2480090 RepID=UPI0025D1CBA6|nr:hypothetical protein [Sulfuritalea sp.]